MSFLSIRNLIIKKEKTIFSPLFEASNLPKYQIDYLMNVLYLGEE
jgi:hypothetical protein